MWDNSQFKERPEEIRLQLIRKVLKVRFVYKKISVTSLNNKKWRTPIAATLSSFKANYQKGRLNEERKGLNLIQVNKTKIRSRRAAGGNIKGDKKNQKWTLVRKHFIPVLKYNVTKKNDNKMLLMEKYWVSKTPLNHESRKWTEIWNNRKYWNKNLRRRKIRLKHHRGKLELAKWTQTWRKSDSKGFKEWLMSLKKGGLELCLLAVILAWATVPLIVCTLFFMCWAQESCNELQIE